MREKYKLLLYFFKHAAELWDWRNCIRYVLGQSWPNPHWPVMTLLGFGAQFLDINDSNKLSSYISKPHRFTDLQFLTLQCLKQHV